MKYKRLIASMLTTIMLVMLNPLGVSANIQLPIESLSATDVSADKGYHPITGNAMISPKVTLAWEDPEPWDPGTPGGGANEQAHEPERYLIEVNDTSSSGSSTIPFPYDSTDSSEKQYTISNLETGTLYEFQVIPEHSHINLAGDEVPVRPSYNETIYVMTDLAVELEATDSNIDVKFDDVAESNVTYRITYAQVDYQDGDPRSKFENSAKKYQIDVTEGQTTQDTESGKLVYTLSENIEPGKPYAITVEPIVDLGTKAVVYNTQPNIYPIHTTIYFEALDDGEYIRFEWDISESFKINDGKHELVKTSIYEFVDGATEGQIIVEFPGQNGAEVDYYKILQKQGINLEYQLVLEYDGYDDLVKSEKVLFVPNQTVIEPTKPIIPEPYPKSVDEYLKDFLSDSNLIQGDVGAILEDYMNIDGLSAEDAVERLLRENYLIDGDTYEAESISALYDENRTFHIIDNEDKINFTWSAFRYRDFDTTSPTYGQTITDFNVYYDIWVTDDLNALATADKLIEDKLYSSNLEEELQIKNTDDTVLGFSYILDQYYDAEAAEMRDIVPGQIYYIQVLAKKKYGQEFILSDPALTSIYFSYDGDAFAPPTMSNPPLEVIDVTTTTTKLQWYEEWYEILSSKPEDANDPNTQITAWSHEVWVDSNGDVYEDPVTGGQYFELLTQDDVAELRDYIGITEFDDNFISRKVDMGEDPYGVSDVKYDLLKLDYEDVEKELKIIRETSPDYTLDQYVKDLMEKEASGQVELDWQNIDVVRDPADTNVISYEQTGLQPNEIYLFLLKPYREMANGDILMSYYPATAVVKTLETDEPLTPKPTVPYLEVTSGYSDVEMKLIWDYNDAFDYSIRYGTEEEFTKSKEFEWDITNDYDEGSIPSFIDDYSTVVDDLFPDTTYYFWIQATSKANGESSSWSSPVMGKTTDLDAPDPPRGVGMGSYLKITEHDIDEPIGKDYITVEWVLDSDDTYGKEDEGTQNKVEKKFSYLLEVSDNPLFLDAIRAEITDESIGGTQGQVKILDKNLVLVENLIANRIYYIRMKTKVTITMSEISKEIVKESYKYSPTIFLVTSITGEEYDGMVDPSKEILPDDDFELIYDKDKNQLEYRFRSDDDDDNNVDQRLITELISNHSENYEVDIRKYKKEPIDSWVITIPDTIMQAFQEQQVALMINTGNMLLELPYDTFNNVASNDFYQYGSEPIVTMTIDKVSESKQGNNIPEGVDDTLSDTYDMNINVTNEMTSYNIVYTSEAFDVKLRPNSRYEFTEKEADAYVYNPETSKWTRANGYLEKDAGLVVFETEVVGSYGLFTNEDTVKNVSHWSETYRKEVLKDYNITGYEDNYDPNEAVQVEEIANLVLGIVNGQKDIQLDQNLYDEEMTQLIRAGIVSNNISLNDTITHYEATEILVKTYELLEGQQLYANPSLSERDQIMAKAYDIELISEKELENPNEALTYGNLFYMLNAFID
ncbi:fibronectin type III domain-containing protein [Vallitalea okinawensis]|uniref:fibronectin type III domain-containing protein n=1 Tax=Vallitalea okinawensis TaxID=2078660 RepID=UPI000CFB83A5|nr:fibronectin type III domain-containing protein [Vallitalea okinawensis]